MLCLWWIEAPVDTNVARVLVRLHGITPSRHEARRSPEVWELASELVGQDVEMVREINWALLDLGAQICTAPRAKVQQMSSHRQVSLCHCWRISGEVSAARCQTVVATLLANSKCETLGAPREHELDGGLVSTLRPLL